MKTTYKTWTDSRKARQKRIELEQKTGPKWDWYSTGQGMKFTPIVTRETPVSEEAARALSPYLTKRGAGFVKLAEISKLDLHTVLIGAKTLVRQGMAIPIVNRCGNFAGIRRKA